MQWFVLIQVIVKMGRNLVAINIRRCLFYLGLLLSVLKITWHLFSCQFQGSKLNNGRIKNHLSFNVLLLIHFLPPKNSKNTIVHTIPSKSSSLNVYIIISNFNRKCRKNLDEICTWVYENHFNTQSFDGTIIVSFIYYKIVS